jgi:hypothetical protein
VDDHRFDALAKSLSAAPSRRGLLAGLLTALGLAGAADAKPEEQGKAGGRKGGKAHGRNRGNGHGNGRNRKGKRCNPKPDSEVCAGKCGDQKDNCGRRVRCPDCTCATGCPGCTVCNPRTGACDPDGGQDGDCCAGPTRDGVCAAGACGECAAGTPFCAAGACVECAGDGDCGGALPFCVGGACVACRQGEADCPGGCCGADGACVAARADCGGGKVCTVTGACATPCTTVSQPCPGGGTCESAAGGQRVCVGEPRGCSDNFCADCGAGRVCFASGCNCRGCNWCGAPA